METQQRARRIAELLTPFLASEGLVPWGVEISSAGRRELLRIFIDVSPEAREIRGAGRQDGRGDRGRLRRGQPPRRIPPGGRGLMPGPYVLEVSSPGIERRFFTAGQMAGHVGCEVEVTLALPRQAAAGSGSFDPGRGRVVHHDGRSRAKTDRRGLCLERGQKGQAGAPFSG
jgi:hypothetical protein